MTASVLTLLVGGQSLAALPAPSAGDDGGSANLEVWLDRPLPSDAKAGSTIAVGFMVWDTRLGDLSEVGGLYFTLKPAAGKARPTSAETRSDFPGHMVANVIVPRGDAGEIEVGVTGRSCTSDGTCKDARFPFRIAGSGPPRDAPRSRLVTAIVQAPTVQIPTGQPFDVGVDVLPRVDWDAAALALPDRLIVVATLRDHGDVASTDLVADPSAPLAFHGSLTVQDAGEIALAFGFPVNGGADDVIGAATTRMRIVGDAIGGSPSPSSGGQLPSSTAAPPSDQPPWVLIVVGAVLVVAAGFAIQRAFADL